MSTKTETEFVLFGFIADYIAFMSRSDNRARFWTMMLFILCVIPLMEKGKKESNDRKMNKFYGIKERERKAA